jgi:hypothetical protein
LSDAPNEPTELHSLLAPADRRDRRATAQRQEVIDVAGLGAIRRGADRIASLRRETSNRKLRVQ